MSWHEGQYHFAVAGGCEACLWLSTAGDNHRLTITADNSERFAPTRYREVVLNAYHDIERTKYFRVTSKIKEVHTTGGMYALR